MKIEGVDKWHASFPVLNIIIIIINFSVNMEVNSLFTVFVWNIKLIGNRYY